MLNECIIISQYLTSITFLPKQGVELLLMSYLIFSQQILIIINEQNRNSGETILPIYPKIYIKNIEKSERICI